MNKVIYWNGEFLPYDEVRVPLEDRGYLFADGIYEVIRVYKGRPFALKEHLVRLENGAKALKIPLPLSPRGITAAAEKLIALNDQGGDSTLYLQLTRGTAPRSHIFPAHEKPNFWMMVSRFQKRIDYQKGVKAITVPDERWSRCYIKSIALLPNVLAREKARRAKVFEALMVRDGFVTEGSSCSFFMVNEGILKTPPLTNYILPGITRQIALQLCDADNIPYEETYVGLDEIYQAEEVFITSATIEIVPVIAIDNVKIGRGTPGKRTKELLSKYRSYVGFSNSGTGSVSGKKKRKSIRLA